MPKLESIVTVAINLVATIYVTCFAPVNIDKLFTLYTFTIGGYYGYLRQSETGGSDSNSDREK
jgi:uncharacterized membrane protein